MRGPRPAPPIFFWHHKLAPSSSSQTMISFDLFMEIFPKFDNSHEKKKNCRWMQMGKMEICISDAGVSCAFKALLWPTACASASGFASLLKLKALRCGTNLSASLKITSLNVYCLGVPRKYFREISCITATKGVFSNAPRPILMSLFAQQ